MKVYVIAELNITNSTWVPEYLSKVTPMVESYGGRYLARTGNIELLEGEKEIPNTMVVIEFPSREDAQRFYDSEEYHPFKESRLAGSTGTFQIVLGEDIAAG